MNALEVYNLQKSFGNHAVLQGVSFWARKGTILGFVGKNGAGKTTTMKILTGLLASDEGEIVLSGNKMFTGLGYKGVPIGYLPDVPSFYHYMKPLEYLVFCGEIMGEDLVNIKEQSHALLELVGLKGVDKRIGTFSRGMKQRLGMAQALMGKPKLLLCDEPTSALDPLGRREILELISRIKDYTTVVFSTHVLSDVEQVCDDVAILDQGKIVHCGSMVELKEKHATSLLTVGVDSKDDVSLLLARLRHLLPAVEIRVDHCQLTLNLPIDPGKQDHAIKVFWSILQEEKMILNRYLLENPTLEQVFVEVTK